MPWRPPRQQSSVWSPWLLGGALPVTCELNGDPMDGETLTVDDELPLTDELIVDLVLKALHASPYGRLRHLQAYCDNGRVTLQGRLPTYYLKQVVQALIDTVPGVRDIDNDVKVFSPR